MIHTKQPPPPKKGRGRTRNTHVNRPHAINHQRNLKGGGAMVSGFTGHCISISVLHSPHPPPTGKKLKQQTWLELFI